MTSTTSAATTPPPPPRFVRDLYARAAGWFPLRGRARSVALFLYYLAILIGLLLIYSRGNFTTPTFIYQGF